VRLFLVYGERKIIVDILDVSGKRQIRMQQKMMFGSHFLPKRSIYSSHIRHYMPHISIENEFFQCKNREKKYEKIKFFFVVYWSEN